MTSRAFSFLPLAAVTAGVLGMASVGLAQYYPWPEYNPSTPAESYARGLGDVIQSAGAYNLATSEAAINATQAQKQFIENRDQWTDTYFQMRQANRAYRETEQGPRLSMEQLVRLAQEGKPKPLSPGELDSVTGRISWPLLLKTSAFDATRAKLDDLFAKRASRGGIDFEQQMQIRQSTKDMLALLKGQIRNVPADDYIPAKRFVESLAYEGQKPAG